MNLLKKELKFSIFFAFFVFFAHAELANANILYSQLDDSTELSGTNFSGSSNTFTNATGNVKEVRISYNDKGNTAGHFIAVGIVDADTGTTYYGYNPSVSLGCSNTFESSGLNTKQILTFDNAWEWRAYPCGGTNLIFNPTHHYYLTSFRSSGGANTQSFYGSSADPNSFYAYIENTTTLADSQKSILTFDFTNLTTGVIDETNHVITLHIPFGTDLSAITPSITTSVGASVIPNIGTPQNFSDSVIYTVTAPDGSRQDYRIKILFDCASGCVSTIAYSQPDNSVEINLSAISSFDSFTGLSGKISDLKFAYHDHGNSAGHFIGVSVVDRTADVNYYPSLNGVCGEAYESTGVNAKVIVELDSSVHYRAQLCAGPELVLDPSHVYGISLFRNRGGSNTQTFYGSSDTNDAVYLYVESQSASPVQFLHGTQLPGSIGANCNPACIVSPLFDSFASSQNIFVTNYPYDPSWGAFQSRSDSLASFTWDWSWAHDPDGLGNFMVSIPGTGSISDPQYYILFHVTGGIIDSVSLPTSCTVDCFSNVLFLPGIKGSVLKKNSDTLWPPTVLSFNDISQLGLTEEGESMNDIHTSGIINSFHGTDIYAPFSDFMNGIAGDSNLINDWLPLAYDWRFSSEKILEDGIKTENEVLDVIAEMENLAQGSKSKKVTIVAHSMGGLLGKAIIKKLQEEGKDNLIDSFVMIGTPQLGTSQAIASMLHGDSEGILAGFIANPAEMRAVAQNMQSAYDLLPSPRYFNEVSDSVIKFNTDALFTEAWRNFWGESINTYNNFFSFLIGGGVPRDKPVEDILKNPEVLRGDLMLNAKNFHEVYDDYQFPEHIRVVQVAGWGVPTVKAVEYKLNHGIPSYDTIPTIEGDRTVVYKSAISSVVDETYFFNLDLYREPNNKMLQHRDLLNAGPIQDVLELLIKNENILQSSFITSSKPQVVNVEDQLIVSTHSPVVLGAYDQLGNFTGIDPNQDLSADILSVSENIPGSTFLYTSESQSIFLPKEGNYNFIYKGIGTGPTTVTIDNFSADVLTHLVSYTDMPTIPNTTATFTVQSLTPENTTIALNSNSDGTVDEVVSPDGTELSLEELITLIKQKISTLEIKDKLKQNLLKRIISIEKKILKNSDNPKKKQVIIKKLSNLSKNILKKANNGRMPDENAQILIDLLNQIEAVI